MKCDGLEDRIEVSLKLKEDIIDAFIFLNFKTWYGLVYLLFYFL